LNPVVISYLIILFLGIVLKKVSNESRLYTANFFTIGVLSVGLLLYEVLSLLTAYQTGYFYEYGYGAKNLTFWTILIKYGCLLIPILNLTKRFRLNHVLQIFIVLLFSVRLILKSEIFTSLFFQLIGGEQYVNRTIGWGNTAYFSTLEILIFTVIFSLILNFLIIKLKMLPEFRNEAPDEDILDNLK